MGRFRTFIFARMTQAIVLAFVILFSVWVNGALGQTARNCGPREMVIERLATGFGETRRSMGIVANNSVIEVFASEQSQSWTITVTSPNGITCLVASGQAYEALREELPAPGDDL